MKYIIRLAEEKDVAQIKKIANIAYSIYVPRMNKKPFPMLDDYNKHVSDKNVYVLCGEESIFGYVVFMEKNSDSLLLDNIAILPEFQGQGYGCKLIEYTESFARDKKYKHITLYTNEVMRENIDFYISLGYKITGNKVEMGYKRIYFIKNLSD